MVPMNFYQCWKAKLEKPHFFKVQSGKITVCYTNIVTTCNKLQRKSPRLIISNPETALNDDDL